MWETIQDLIYVGLLLMFASTFLSPRARRRAIDALAALWHALEPLAYQVVTGRPMPSDEQPIAPIVSRSAPTNRTEPNAPVRGEFLLPAAENAPDEPQSSVRGSGYALVLTEEELAAVARMVQHNRTVEKPTQSSTIEAGFGYKRGGGPGYDRAREIYQAIFTPPKVAKFPELTPDKKRALPKATRVQQVS